MPLDAFDDRNSARSRDRNVQPNAGAQAASALRALLGDIAYFWWAFASLGAVMLAAYAC